MIAMLVMGGAVGIEAMGAGISVLWAGGPVAVRQVVCVSCYRVGCLLDVLTEGRTIVFCTAEWKCVEKSRESSARCSADCFF